MSSKFDPEFEKGLPASLDAERTILGAILLDNSAYNEAAEKIIAEDFAHAAHQRIFARMRQLVESGKQADLVTVAEELARLKQVESVGGVAYLSSLTEGLPRNLAIDEYVEIVKDKSMARAFLRTVYHLGNRAADQSEKTVEILDSAEAYFREIADRAVHQGFSTMQEVVAAHYKSLDEFLYAQQKAGSVLSGWSDYDKFTRGFRPSELTILAARPSMGKSAWAVNVAGHAAVRQRKSVGIFSLEMDKESLLRRLVSGMAHVSAEALAERKVSSQQQTRIAHVMGEILEAPLYIDDTPAITLSEMRAKAKRLQASRGLDLVLVDYLQLMSGGRKFENRTQEVSALSRGLKALAKDLKVPLIALSQLSRANEQRQDKRPMLSDLRESGSIEQDADVVTFLFRPEYYDRNNPELKGMAEFILAKQRNGPIGKVDMLFFDAETRFECPETRYDDYV